MSTLIVGCGYLGRRVGRLLAQKGERVFGTVRSEARARELTDWGVEPVTLDVLDPRSRQQLPDADRIVYCVGFDRSAGIPIREVYVEGLRNILEHLEGRGVRRLVYASSTGVYGQDDGGWVDEDSPTLPRHESGRACLDAENLARESGRDRGIGTVILRFSGLYGPGRIPRRAAVERGEPILGDPSKFLNLVHIDDASRATVAALDHSSPGRTFLVSDDRPVERLEFYRLIAEHLSAPPPSFAPPGPGPEEADKRISNRRMHAELRIALDFPDISTGVPAALWAESAGSKPLG